MNDEELVAHLRSALEAPGQHSALLRDTLEQLIDSSRLEHGRRLPTERRLAEVLGLSRVVVRNAFNGLERLGAARRRQGSGTYVQSARIEGSLRVLGSFSEELPSHGYGTKTRVLQFGFATPDVAVQRELELAADVSSAVKLVRVRFLNEQPSTFEVSWTPVDVAGHLVGADLTDASLFRLLAETRGIRASHATERLRVAGLDSVEAAALRCSPGTPAFLVDRTTFDDHDRPIEYAHTLLRGDRFYYSTTLEAPSRLAAQTASMSRFETLADG